MTAAVESAALTAHADWRPKSITLTDADSWEDPERLSPPQRPSASTTIQGSQGTLEDIQRVYDTGYGYEIVSMAPLPFAFTSFGETLPEIFRAVFDRGELASTTEVSSEDLYAFESSTTQSEGEIRMDSRVKALFRAATQESFEDGMESGFSNELIRLVKQYGDAVISILARLILSETVNVEVASIALRSLGETQHPQSYNSRLWLLERSLHSSSPWIRDGAALGLAWLNDPTAIPYLRQAVEEEPIHELRRNMELVIEQLARVRLCH